MNDDRTTKNFLCMRLPSSVIKTVNRLWRLPISHWHGSICVGHSWHHRLAFIQSLHPFCPNIASVKCFSMNSINQSITGCEFPMLEVIQVSMHYVNNSKIICYWAVFTFQIVNPSSPWSTCLQLVSVMKWYSLVWTIWCKVNIIWLVPRWPRKLLWQHSDLLSCCHLFYFIYGRHPMYKHRVNAQWLQRIFSWIAILPQNLWR